MIASIFSLLLYVIFLTFSGFHFYWLCNGKWGLSKVIPVKNEGENLPIPKSATLLVALVLLFFGIIYLSKSQMVDIPLNNAVILYAGWFITIIFALRALGDFNYLGFFKKIKNTEFAEADRKIFIPLCLIISFSGVLIELF